MNKSLGRILFTLVTAAFLLHPMGLCLADQPVHMQYPIKLMNLETGYVLGHGQNVRIGIGDSGFGVKDRIQFSTNTLMDIVTLVNGQVKINVLPEWDILPALSVGAAYYNLVSSQFVVDTVVEEAFSEEEMDLSAGLDILYWFISASRSVGPRIRFHAGYQHRYLKGELRTEKPVELDTDDGSMKIDLEFEETASHSCLLFGADLDVFDHLKFMVELGHDFSYGKSRGGVAFRLGIGGSFALQAGMLWPGLDLDEDIDVPVLPHFTLFTRF